jgi:hypothetical protein
LGRPGNWNTLFSKYISLIVLLPNLSYENIRERQKEKGIRWETVRGKVLKKLRSKSTPALAHAKLKDADGYEVHQRSQHIPSGLGAVCWGLHTHLGGENAGMS